MALKLNEAYPGRFNNPSADYPQGSFKNRTAPDAQDGSYFEQRWANDQLALFSSLLASAGIEPNGEADKVGASQYFDALESVIEKLSPVTPDASTTVKGKVELATNAETISGTDTDRSVTPAGLSARVGSETQTGLLQLATQVEAEAGTETTKAVSVRRVWQAITSRFATQAQVNAGVDDTTMVTPLKMRSGFSASIGLNGYIAFPTWLGGLIIQWMFTTSATTNHVLTLPLAAPTELLVVIPVCQAAGAGTANIATWDRSASTLSTARISTTGVNNIAVLVFCR